MVRWSLRFGVAERVGCADPASVGVIILYIAICAKGDATRWGGRDRERRGSGQHLSILHRPRPCELNRPQSSSPQPQNRLIRRTDSLTFLPSFFPPSFMSSKRMCDHCLWLLCVLIDMSYSHSRVRREALACLLVGTRPISLQDRPGLTQLRLPRAQCRSDQVGLRHQHDHA